MKDLANLYSMLKAENPAAYKKLAEKGVMVAHPVSIAGEEKRPDIGINYHATIKFFNPEKDRPEVIHGTAKNLNFSSPDPKQTRIEPGVFKDRLGNDVYVIKLHGPHADEIKQHNKKFSHMGYPATYEYHPHISVDKKTWERIVASKAKTAHEAGIKFGPAKLYQGKDVLATYPDKPKTEKLSASEMQKGLKEFGAALGIAASAVGSHDAIPSAKENSYSSERMLQAIGEVESTSGKFTNHRALSGIHDGESAYGRFGITPVVIRETVRLHRDLKSQHGKLLNLKGRDLHHYMQDNPGLEEEIAKRHLSRLEHHFGQNPKEIAYSWLNGISGTYKAKKESKDIDNHWHVEKVKKAYGNKL